MVLAVMVEGLTLLSQSCKVFVFFPLQSKPHFVEVVIDMDKVVNPFNQSSTLN